MKRLGFLFHPVVIFVSAQLAWLSLLGIWIYWYVTNYIIFTTAGDKISPQLLEKNTNIVALVTGLVLLVAILGGMYLIFIYLSRQLKITNLYDNFIANITHELKSPLASIQLHLDTLASRELSQEKRNQFIALMSKDANRLKQLIDSILGIAQLEQKKIAHNFQIYTVDEVVRDIINESEFQFNLSENILHVAGNAPCKCVIDRNAFKIVIDNLIDNALKYSHNTPTINIRLDHNDKSWSLEVCDNGIGISKSDQKNIFLKFQRIYHKDSPNVKGTGLGLYWVRQIVRYHGGNVNVTSDGVGHGTCFRIELPVYRRAKKRHIQQLLDLTKTLHQSANKSFPNNDKSEHNTVIE
ncbi:HAMP domain-containing histidine kinase [candidate division KSB1 bacterium]|nr:HAMP domain-containing histidine kinase [candidate division KSB1 bacterium]